VRTTIAVMLTLGMVVACSGQESEPETPETFTVSGTMTVEAMRFPGDVPTPGSPCRAKSGHGDIEEGTQVAVLRDAGGTLALGQLGDGRAGGPLNDFCLFPFTVQDVPAGEGFYKIEIGRRGALRYAEEQLREPLSLNLQ
jgi:hypothetical protein